MSENRRQAYRYTIEPGTQALLRTGEGEVVVHIVNQSASGFGLEFEHEIELQEGELATLTTTSGQSICRVMHVQYDDLGKTQIGVQRVSEIAEEPATSSAASLLAKNLLAKSFGQGAGSVLLLVTFGLGLGIVMGLTQFPSWKSSSARPAANRSQIPSDPTKKLRALSDQFRSLDKLNSRNFVSTLKLTDGQQRRVEDVFSKLVRDMGKVSVGKADESPEQASHMGLLMIRRAWLQVESILTAEQLAQWDAMLESPNSQPVATQASL